MSYIALIAGAGNMPLRLIEEVKQQGKKVLLIAIYNVTPRSLAMHADIVCWGHITQLGKARRVCLKNNVKEIAMAGLVLHSNIFKLSIFKMDFLTLKVLLSVSDLRADTICGKIIDVFKNKGINFISTTKLLKKYLAPKGILTIKKPSKKVLEDIDFGVKIAQEIGRADIGQCVVVKNKSIVALEAMEGTDKCLQRAGDLAGAGCVVVKLPKPNQDSRFDVPVIGINTIEKLAKIKAKAIAIGAHKSLIIDPEVINLATKLNVAIVSVEI